MSKNVKKCQKNVKKCQKISKNEKNDHNYRLNTLLKTSLYRIPIISLSSILVRLLYSFNRFSKYISTQ